MSRRDMDPPATKPWAAYILLGHAVVSKNNDYWCSICMSYHNPRPKDDPTYIALDTCSHQFYETCFNNWLSKRLRDGYLSACPTCQIELVENWHYRREPGDVMRLLNMYAARNDASTQVSSLPQRAVKEQVSTVPLRQVTQLRSAWGVTMEVSVSIPLRHNAASHLNTITSLLHRITRLARENKELSLWIQHIPTAMLKMRCECVRRTANSHSCVVTFIRRISELQRSELL
jgi:hypothetical protein